MRQAISLLISGADVEQSAAVSPTLALIPQHLLVRAAEGGRRAVLLRSGDTYAAASPALRRLSPGVDTWPIQPAGLFALEERTVYLHSLSPMTVAHDLVP
jgi:hypothetical protein